MSRYTLSDTAIKYISFFESITNTKVKDCLVNEDGLSMSKMQGKAEHFDKIIFVTEEAQAGKAIGRNGTNIKRLENLIKKRIKIIEFNSEIAQFIRNMLYPIEVKDIKIENNIIYISGKDRLSNGYIIGRDGRNLDFLTSLVKRYFDVHSIKVV